MSKLPLTEQLTGYLPGPTPLHMRELIDIARLETDLHSAGFQQQLPAILDAVKHQLETHKHGHLDRWLQALRSLPEPSEVRVELKGTVTVESVDPTSEIWQQNLEQSLRQLIPWRKGPFSICGVTIDTEWRSDWKWDRLQPHIKPLSGRCVLDVGCGSGYHLWRMLGEGARFALGIDPGVLFVAQFNAVQHFIQSRQTAILPLPLEQLPPDQACFDTVFSMGVLYHRKDPHEHLRLLRGQLRDGGELVLETLVMPPGHPTLIPEGRYARMRNIGQIPSSATLVDWLRECGFSEIRVVSEEPTSLQEQRPTDWMPFESLEHSLAPLGTPEGLREQPAADTSQDTAPERAAATTEKSATERLTIEGHPAPRRAVILANR